MDEFNIAKYDTSDLYALLDVDSSISDRVLEAKILSMINQYKTAKATTSGNDDEYDQVINFMIDVYKYFFDNADVDEDKKDNNDGGPDLNGNDEGDGRGDVRGRDIKLEKPYDKRNDDFDFDSNPGSSTINDFERTELDAVGNRAGEVELNNTDQSQQLDQKDRGEAANVGNSSKFTFSYPLQYATDNDGQIINQATKRIVSINSGSRYNPAGTTSSSFTLNLSETLKNVVKLKLYSVSIPYSWYTISEDYGSNFFYIKGNSPGIYNETHDIKIQIEPGNYTSGTLITTLNNAIDHLKGKTVNDVYITENNLHIPDVSLNNTKIEYSSNSGKTKFFIGIKKNYDSNYFRVRFPYITPVYSDSGTKERNNDLSIPSFLGFTTETLNSYTVRSDLKGTDPTVKLDESNHTIKILRYIQNANNTFDGTNVLKTIDLSFNYGVETDISSNGINSVLTNDDDINNASEYVIDNSGNYLKLKLERDNSINNLNTKVIILFPFNKANMTNIWTDELKFKTDGTTTYLDISYNYKILNDVFSQEPAVNDRILVPSSRSIKMEFIPTKPLYNGLDINDNVLTSDVSLNKFELVIPTKDSGYTNDEFITAINTGFDNINATFTDNHNTKIFNKTSNENIMRLDNNELKLDIDISYNLGISNYLLDLSGTIMGRLLGIESEYHDYDLSNNSVLNDDITINGDIITITKSGWTQKTEGYFLSGTVNATATPFVLKLKPKQDGPVRNLPVINVPPHPRYYVDENIDGIFKTNELGGISGFAKLINDSLQEYSNTSFNNTNLLGDCSFSTEVVDEGSSTARFDLSLNVSDYLDETNYELVLTDTDSDVWSNRFYLDLNSSYDLSANPNITSIGSKTIDKDVITIDNTNSQIIIEPLPVNIDGGSNGVFDTLNRNTIYINIPNISYTRNELINKINDLLKTTIIASGKILSDKMSFIIKDDDYCLIDFNLNRMFQARDFKVVFFDSTFSSCNIGSTSIQNTTYDSTIGYILGYRDQTEYQLINVIDSARVDVKQFISKQQLNVNLYNEFSIVLDDYNNNRLPSAIVSGLPPSTDFEIPTYAKRAASSCDENGNLLLSVKDKNNNNLTAKQLSAIYSNIETSQAKQTDIFRANQKVIAKDVFAVIPLNVAGLTAGELFVKEGLTLQEQTRSYFGPVDIQRISVKILTDKGTLVNLNQDNWSFSFVCEQIHDQTLGQYIKDSKDDGS